ncbi:MAG: potassium channel protein [Clostridiales bacterium]|nr:potassium channel protein [Clostridiales bacterium]
MEESNWEKTQKKLFAMVSTGVTDSKLNQFYDIFSTLALVANLVCAFAATFDSVKEAHGALLTWVDEITVLFFAIDYVLRILTARQQYRGYSAGKAIGRYVTSGYGIIDLLSFLPHYMPTFFPAGAAVFRMFRVVRIFRLFRINAYSDSLSLIGNVISKKKTQLLASVFVITLLILASSLCMYSVEHEAQPDVFKNAFSAIWWATSTLLTVGYGDIYPITVVGQILGIIITFLGVGLVAIPTGIISAGFVEEYQLATRLADIEQEQDVRFIKASIDPGDAWIGKTISEVAMPSGSIIALVIRDGDTMVPRGDVEILEGDKLIICAESATEGMLEDVKEIILRKNHAWNGMKIRDLDISRQTFIVLVERDGRTIKPDGDLMLQEGDKVLIYTKENVKKYTQEPLF